VDKVFALTSDAGDVALLPDGSALLATEAAPEGRLVRIDLESGESKGTNVGHTPVAIAVDVEGGRAYVCNRFSNDISVVDVRRMKERERIPALREPIAAVLADGGRTLFVANHLPTGSANGEYTGAAVSVIDVRSGKTREPIALPNGSTGLRGIAASPDGNTVYVTHILARYQLPTTQLERGWMNTNALSIIDAAEGKLVNTVLLDDVDLGAANPWGVACTPDGSTICVAHAGTHEVSLIDRHALHARLADVAAGKRVTQVSDSPENVPNDLSFLVGIRRRLKLNGNGPRGLAVIGDMLYAAEYFSDTVGRISLNGETVHRPASLALGPQQPLTEIRKGEMFFNDADLCFQHWQSCASCHPDARADGLNWDLLNDGMGNPKQTKSMLLSHKTPPVMVSGIRPDAQTAVRAGIRYIQFAVRPDEDADAIDAYLTSLDPVPSPYLKNGKLTRAAKRGEKVFNEAGCAACHPPPLFTDLTNHNVGIADGREKGREFDTPTLVENWRTAPYLYDGRAATMLDVLTTCNTDDNHGHTSDLSKRELSDLAEFILSQ
jgi:YVTN family beta-propeller protein